MSVRIGISPIAWQNDDLPDLTAAFTMEQALKEAREIGYTGVERGRRMPQDTEGLRAYLDRYDIALCGGWCSGNLMRNSVEGGDRGRARPGRAVRGARVALPRLCRMLEHRAGRHRHARERPPEAFAFRDKGLRGEAHGACEVDGRTRAWCWPTTTTWAR
jgi:sugar phosphate isomerase/epimerase